MRRLLARLLLVPTLGWNVLLGRILRLRHWWDRVDRHVLIGALPFPWDVPRLRQEGVQAVVNTCEEYAGPLRAYDKLGITQLRVPTVDFTAPRLEQVEQAVAFIAQQVEQGRTVYIHCKAGRGRSATIVLCWLIEAKNLTPEQAQQLLLAKRHHVNRHLAERKVVQQFYERRQR